MRMKFTKPILFGALLGLGGCVAAPYSPDTGYEQQQPAYSYQQPGYYYEQQPGYYEQQPGYVAAAPPPGSSGTSSNRRSPERLSPGVPHHSPRPESSWAF
jgi:hypothetical protein